MNRRRAALFVSGLVLSSVGGCGFALRQPKTLPFRTATLSGFSGRSPLATELAQALEANGVDVVDTTAQAAALAPASGAASGAAALAHHVIIDALQDSREQVVASSTAFGQVRDLTLRTRLRFRVLRADGSVWLPPTELVLSRDVTYNERDALAKQNEIEALHRAMQTDIVAQTLRRLAALRTPAPR